MSSAGMFKWRMHSLRGCTSLFPYISLVPSVLTTRLIFAPVSRCDLVLEGSEDVERFLFPRLLAEYPILIESLEKGSNPE